MHAKCCLSFFKALACILTLYYCFLATNYKALPRIRFQSSQVCGKFRLSPAMVRTSQLAARLLTLRRRTKWKKVYRAVRHPALPLLEISSGQSGFAILDTNEISANQIGHFGHTWEATQDVLLLYYKMHVSM